MGLFVSACLGLIAGSFVNAYVWRQHKGISVVKGRSKCPDCEHYLTASDLIPLLSWLYLRGKCRYCQRPISFQYPLVELVTAGLFVISYLVWPYILDSALAWIQLLVWFGIVSSFVALSVYDFKWYLLPNRMLAHLLVLVVIFQLLSALSGEPLIQWLVYPLLGAVGAFSFFYLLHIVGKGKWMGGGDVKLVFVLGLLVGGMSAVVGLMVAFVSAALVGIALMLLKLKSRRDMVPFGPFLMAGFWVAFLFADQLSEWYINLFIVY